MFITKYNAVCNLGNNIDEIYEAALKGCSDRFEVRDFARLARAVFLEGTINDKNYNLRCNKLLLEALKPLEIEKLDKDSTAIITASTNSGVEEYEITKNPKHYQLGNPAEFIKEYYGFKNFSASVSTACSSGIKAFTIAKELLLSGVAETVLVSGVDAIAKLPLYGFHALEILSNEPSLPFSKNRKGINIGEGAAVFILKSTGKSGIEVVSTGETTDFYHSTTPDPEGIEAERAIRLALGNTDPREVDYINLHGTGSIANDLTEAKVIYNIFKDYTQASSTKPLTGHCLGAAASIEAALCCALIDKSRGKENLPVFPHIYDGVYDNLLPRIFLADKDTRVKKINTCLSVSFGFGGTNCAMLLRGTTVL